MRRTTDQPQVDEKKKRKKAESFPAFDPKARGAALRAAFLKAAHPDAETDDAGNKTLNQSLDTNTHQEEPESRKAASDDPGETEEGKQGKEEQKEIKPQIERELFAEYVVVEDDDDETEEPQKTEKEQSPTVEPESESEPEQKPRADTEQNQGSEPKPTDKEPTEESLVADDLPQEEPAECSDKTPEVKREQMEEPSANETVPAPVPIIEEVVATPIDKPEETNDNQVMVKRPKLGFFARLKLLFFGGRAK